jgi:TnpA family transposase
VNIELIREQWESLVRVAASLKNRIVTADVIIKRLVNSSPADRLSRALTELGRLVKSVNVLIWLCNLHSSKNIDCGKKSRFDSGLAHV